MKILLFIPFVLSSCMSYSDMYQNKYSSFGGDADVSMPGGGHITHSHTASAQHFWQFAGAAVSGVVLGMTQRASDAATALTAQQGQKQATKLASQKLANDAAAQSAADAQKKLETLGGLGLLPAKPKG